MLLSCRGPLRGFRQNALLALPAAVLIVVTTNAGIAHAQAQGAASSPSSAPNSSDAAPSERAKRDADKVFHWILIQGDRTRKSGGANASKDANASSGGAAKAAAPAAQPGRTATRADAPAETPVQSPRVRPDPTLASAAPVAGSASPGASAASSTPSVQGSGDGGTASPLTPAAAPANSNAGADKPDPTSAAGAQVAGKATDTGPKLEDSKPEPAADSEGSIDLVPISQPEPQFAISTMRTLRKGTVQVKFTVQPDGSVTAVEVMQTTSARLNSAALAAIGQWRFQPISKAVTGAVELGFNLE